MVRGSRLSSGARDCELRRYYGTMPLSRQDSIVTAIVHHIQSPPVSTENLFALRHLSGESRIVNRLERTMRC